MNLDLGGPGPGCSALRVRRLLAGELQGAEKERVEQHVFGCARCATTAGELREERAQLLRDVSFDAFAAGVAEKLASAQPQPRALPLRWLAAAAGILLAASAGLLVLRPADDGGVRSKGGASAQVFVQGASGVRELRGEAVAPGARLLVSLHPAGHKRARVVLVEPGEETVIYDGPAVNGALPAAFEWTGGARATLRIILDASETMQIDLHR